MAYQKIENSLNPITVDATEQTKDMDFYLGFEKQDDEHSFNEMLNECSDIAWDTASWCNVKLKIQDNTAYKITLNIQKNEAEEPRNCTVTFYNQSFDKNESDTKIEIQQQGAFYPFIFFNINNANTLESFPFNNNDETTNIQLNNTEYDLTSNELFNFKFGKKNKTNFLTTNNFNLSGTMLKPGSTTETVNISDVLEIVNTGDKFTLKIKNSRPVVKKNVPSSDTKILLNFNSNQYTLKFTVKIPNPQLTNFYIQLDISTDYITNHNSASYLSKFHVTINFSNTSMSPKPNIPLHLVSENTTFLTFYQSNGDRQQGYFAEFPGSLNGSGGLTENEFNNISEININYWPNQNPLNAVNVAVYKFGPNQGYSNVYQILKAALNEPFNENVFSEGFLMQLKIKERDYPNN